MATRSKPFTPAQEAQPAEFAISSLPDAPTYIKLIKSLSSDDLGIALNDREQPSQFTSARWFSKKDAREMAFWILDQTGGR